MNHECEAFPSKDGRELPGLAVRQGAVFKRFRQLLQSAENHRLIRLGFRQDRCSVLSDSCLGRGIRRFPQERQLEIRDRLGQLEQAHRVDQAQNANRLTDCFGRPNALLPPGL